MNETKETYKCMECGQKKHLIISRGVGKYCKKCYDNILVKRRVLRELNKVVE